MLTCCLKKILGLVLSWSCSVYAVEIPQEEDLSISCLKNGVQIWLKTQGLQTDSVACRFVAKHPLEQTPQIKSLRCPASSFEDELPCFIETCRESIRKEAECSIGIIAVGQFDKKGLQEALGEICGGFLEKKPVASSALSITPATDNIAAAAVHYPASTEMVKTKESLKKALVLYILQAIVEERWKKDAAEAEGEWIQTAEVRNLLPYTHFAARGKNTDPSRMLNSFLATVKQLKETGFTELELLNAKAKLQKNLQTFYQQNPTSSILADYYASHFVFGQACPDYSIFMTMALHMVPEIEMRDVADVMRSSFKDATRRIALSVPPGLEISEAVLKRDLENYSTETIVFNWKGDKEAPPEKKDPFLQLSITDEQKQIIYNIIDTTANTEWYKLVFKKSELESLGLKVQNVHPLVFLTVCFTNPHLKKAMKELWYWGLKQKRNGFLEGSGDTAGFAAKMDKEFSKNNLYPYIAGFAQAVKAHPDQIRTLIEQHDWEKFVTYLVDLDS